jgi:hypothetical protein
MATLHLFTGDSAAGTITEALGLSSHECVVQHDVISCGPVRDFASREEWIAARGRFWMEVCGGPTLDEFPGDLVGDAERLRGADRLVLWVGAGLSDRLLLPSLLALAGLIELPLPPIEVAAIRSHRSLKVPVLGWGMLRATDIGRPDRVLVDADEVARARAAWNGLTATTPNGYLQAMDGLDEDADLLAAMSVLIERYPDAVTGLSHWDASLLACVPDTGASGLTIIGGAFGANHHHLDPVGDLYLYWRMRRLASSALNEPLLRMEGEVSVMSQSRFMLTDFGRAVRAGQASQVAVNGIDDWVGGVHLRAAKGSPWYRRNGTIIQKDS